MRKGGKRARLASGLSLKTPHGSAVSLKAPRRSMDKYSTIEVSKKYNNLHELMVERLRKLIRNIY